MIVMEKHLTILTTGVVVSQITMGTVFEWKIRNGGLEAVFVLCHLSAA